MNYIIAIIGILAVCAIGVRWWHYRDYKGRKQNPIKSTPAAPQCSSRASLRAVRAHTSQKWQDKSSRNDDDYLSNPLHPLNPINQADAQDSTHCSSNSHHGGSDWSSSSSYGSGSSSCDSVSSSSSWD